MTQFDQQVAAAKQWFASPRFAGIVRLYSPRQVAEQQGTLSGDYTVARARHFVAPGIPISRACSDDRPCRARCRCVRAGDVQAPRRRGRPIACLFDHQPVDSERDCDACAGDVLNRGAPARQAWLTGAARSRPQYIWKLLLIASSSSSCSRFMRSSFRPVFALTPSP